MQRLTVSKILGSCSKTWITPWNIVLNRARISWLIEKNPTSKISSYRPFNLYGTLLTSPGIHNFPVWLAWKAIYVAECRPENVGTGGPICHRTGFNNWIASCIVVPTVCMQISSRVFWAELSWGFIFYSGIDPNTVVFLKGL